MTAALQRATVFAIVPESVSGELTSPSSATQFVPLKSGFSLSSEVATLDSEELLNDIAPSKGQLGLENPNGSHELYLKHSEVEGQAPSYGLFIESCLGAKTVNATQYTVTTGSSAGTSSARASLEMATNQEDNYEVGQAVLIKDATNGYSIRNVYNVNSAGNQLDLNFNLSAAPASGVGLGKAIFYKPSSSGHPSFSAWMYRGNGAAIEAVAGCRTTSFDITATAGEQLEAVASYAGVSFYYNPIEITSSSKYIDFEDDGGVKVITLEEKIYKSPLALVDEINTKLAATSVDVITVEYFSYGANAGKFKFTSDGTTFELPWATGANTANSAKTKLGFANTDDTGATNYTSDNVQIYTATYTPDYDDATNLVVKNNELMIGSFSDNICREASSLTFSCQTPATDVSSLCAESGVAEKLILSREFTMTGTLILQKHEAHLFDKFINNDTVAIMANFGQKDSSGNWTPGKCVNIYMANATLTQHVVSGDDIIQLELGAKGYVDSSRKDVYINFI